jgi:hypothetical protein
VKERRVDDGDYDLECALTVLADDHDLLAAQMLRSPAASLAFFNAVRIDRWLEACRSSVR